MLEGLGRKRRTSIIIVQRGELLKNREQSDSARAFGYVDVQTERKKALIGSGRIG